MKKKAIVKQEQPVDDLLLRHEGFITEYLSCLNGTLAWKNTYGETDDSIAASSASRLLRNVKVRAELERRFKEATMGKFEVLERLKAIANATLLPFIQIDNNDQGTVYFNFKDPEAKRHFYLIKKVKSRKKETLNDKTAETEQWIEVELHDSLKALELIGKYHALFTDKVINTERKIIKVSFKKDDDEQDGA